MKEKKTRKKNRISPYVRCGYTTGGPYNPPDEVSTPPAAESCGGEWQSEESDAGTAVILPG